MNNAKPSPSHHHFFLVLYGGSHLLALLQDFSAGSRAAIGGGVLDNYQYRIQVSPWEKDGTGGT